MNLIILKVLEEKKRLNKLDNGSNRACIITNSVYDDFHHEICF